MSEAGVGHNSIDNGQLKALIERIERMLEEKQAVADDIKEIYAEAKDNGYDTKTMRKIVKIRAMDKAKRAQEEEILAIYMHALGIE